MTAGRTSRTPERRSRHTPIARCRANGRRKEETTGRPCRLPCSPRLLLVSPEGIERTHRPKRKTGEEGGGDLELKRRDVVEQVPAVWPIWCDRLDERMRNRERPQRPHGNKTAPGMQRHRRTSPRPLLVASSFVGRVLRRPSDIAWQCERDCGDRFTDGSRDRPVNTDPRARGRGTPIPKQPLDSGAPEGAKGGEHIVQPGPPSSCRAQGEARRSGVT